MFLTAKPVSYLVNLSEDQIVAGAEQTPYDLCFDCPRQPP